MPHDDDCDIAAGCWSWCLIPATPCGCQENGHALDGQTKGGSAH